MSRMEAAAAEACSSESGAEAGNKRSVISSASSTSLADSELESGELSSVSEVAEEGSSSGSGCSGSDLILGEEAHWRFLAGGLVEELCFSIEVSISLATAALSQRADP